LSKCYQTNKGVPTRPGRGWPQPGSWARPPLRSTSNAPFVFRFFPSWFFPFRLFLFGSFFLFSLLFRFFPSWLFPFRFFVFYFFLRCRAFFLFSLYSISYISLISLFFSFIYFTCYFNFFLFSFLYSFLFNIFPLLTFFYYSR
jgi:hypothetical protein